jgi:HD-GYP domain
LDEAGFGEQVAEVALYHHEFKKNDNIGNKRPETAEIVSIADVYDALTQDRSYNDGLPEHEAKEIMESEHSFNKSLDWIAEGPM